MRKTPSSHIIYSLGGEYYTLNVRSRGKQLVLFSEGPDIKCFVTFLDFHFNSDRRITGANQNSRLGTYKNTNLILETTE